MRERIIWHQSAAKKDSESPWRFAFSALNLESARNERKIAFVERETAMARWSSLLCIVLSLWSNVPLILMIHRGIDLYVRSLGPFYRVICRDISQDNQVLAVTTGFVAPFLGLMHCDTLQIFTRNRRGEQGERVRGGVLGLGLLVGGATFAYGWEQGCRKAEILAINDDDMWHERLVKYYRRFGFVPVRVVTGGKLSDIPHLLVWGGSGTRMDADIKDMLRRWTPAIRNAKSNSDIKQQKEILHE